MDFKIHTVTSASDDAKPLLQESLGKYKFIPNLHGVMAEAPALLAAYQALGNFWNQTSLSVLERQIVLLTNNYENDCHYCMAAHSTIATMEKMPDDILTALRGGTPLADARLQALRDLARKAVVQRGQLTASDTQAAIDAGYSRQAVVEVVLAVRYKVLGNYANHLAETPVDAPFQAFAWKKDDKAAAE